VSVDFRIKKERIENAYKVYFYEKVSYPGVFIPVNNFTSVIAEFYPGSRFKRWAYFRVYLPAVSRRLPQL
jgi:hypothetical protein